MLDERGRDGIRETGFVPVDSSASFFDSMSFFDRERDRDVLVRKPYSIYLELVM